MKQPDRVPADTSRRAERKSFMRDSVPPKRALSYWIGSESDRRSRPRRCCQPVCLSDATARRAEVQEHLEVTNLETGGSLPPIVPHGGRSKAAH
jgi:hypothetical protein